MADVPAKLDFMTLDDFVRRFDQEGPFEMIDGELIELSPTLFGHNHVANLLNKLLLLHVMEHGLGETLVESPFVLPDQENPNWVVGSRVPDVMLVRADRLEKYKEQVPDWKEKPLELVPDLVVEIIYKKDSYSDVDRKVETYMNDGVQVVWIIDPRRHTVTVHRHESKEYHRFSEEDVLTEDTVIPGFKVPIAELFE